MIMKNYIFLYISLREWIGLGGPNQLQSTKVYKEILDLLYVISRGAISVRDHVWNPLPP